MTNAAAFNRRLTAITGIAFGIFFVFAGGLARYLRSTGEDADGLVGTAFGAAVGALALLLAGVALTNAIAFKAAGSGDQVRVAFDASSDLFAMASFPFAVFF